MWVTLVAGLVSAGAAAPARAGEAATDSLTAVLAFHECERLSLHAPVAVCLDFNGAALVADASPPRLISYDPRTGACQEFQAPADRPAFRPSDVSVRGFFVYAIDETNRLLLRWDASGTYRDVLVNFEELALRRRVSPHGLDVDASGRLAVTDVENHQVIVLDTYLEVDVAFGNYGAYEGQFDDPQGVSFTPRGDLLVADTGNARLQVFGDAGAFKRMIPETGAESPLLAPRRAVMAADGRVFVADPAARRVFEFTAAGVPARAIVPAGGAGFEPVDVALGRDGILYVCDAASRTLFAFKVM